MEDLGGGDDEFGSDDDDPDPAGYAKFNPNHDELGRFTFGSGGADNSDDDNTDAGSSDTGSTAGDFLRWALGISSAHAAGIEEDDIRGTENDNATAEIRTAAYETAISNLRQLDPNNPQLESVSAPNWVPSWDDIDQIRQEVSAASNRRLMNFAMPNGSPVGEKGNGVNVRILPGNLSTAQQDFENLTIGASVLDRPEYRGIMTQLPGGNGFVGLRPESSDELPTLDFNIPNIPFKKIHYK